MECRDSAEDTPLSKATRIGLLESATLLLDHGANVETRNQDEQTPLFIAAFFGYMDLVTPLIERRASVNVKR